MSWLSPRLSLRGGNEKGNKETYENSITCIENVGNLPEKNPKKKMKRQAIYEG
jgi:hypothetical protein